MQVTSAQENSGKSRNGRPAKNERVGSRDGGMDTWNPCAALVSCSLCQGPSCVASLDMSCQEEELFAGFDDFDQPDGSFLCVRTA